MERFRIRSSDTATDLAAYSIEPESPRAMIQIAHGMCEHFGRYVSFAKALSAHGFLVFGHDHLGHGESAKSREDLGFTAANGGSEHLVEDVAILSRHMKALHPTLPLILFGHSMGSFVIREVIARDGELYDAAIICGTGGPETPAALGKLLASLLMKFQGERHRSPLLKKISFMGYNKKFGKNCNPNAWLTRDTSVVERYNDAPNSGFVFTLRAYHDLFTLVDTVSRRNWASRVPKSLPLLLISGDMDPVGNYGKGVRTVYNRLLSAGAEDSTLKLYRDMRHEILNEIDKETVWEDILEWINGKLPSAT